MAGGSRILGKILTPNSLLVSLAGYPIRYCSELLNAQHPDLKFSFDFAVKIKPEIQEVYAADVLIRENRNSNFGINGFLQFVQFVSAVCLILSLFFLSCSNSPLGLIEELA